MGLGDVEKSLAGVYDKEIHLWPLIKKEKWLKDIFNSQKSYDFWTAFDRRYKFR